MYIDTSVFIFLIFLRDYYLENLGEGAATSSICLITFFSYLYFTLNRLILCLLIKCIFPM
jgi:hypothetical protein